jgi:hypothetical protein
MKHSCVGSSPVNHRRAPIPGHRSPLAERPTRLARDVAAVAVVSLLGDAIDRRLPQILPRTYRSSGRSQNSAMAPAKSSVWSSSGRAATSIRRSTPSAPKIVRIP